MVAGEQFDRITVEPGKCGGKPCIRGMRITIRRVLELLAIYRIAPRCLPSTLFLKRKTYNRRYAAATVDDEMLRFA